MSDNNQKSMGDQFVQRRAAAAAAGKNSNSPAGGGGNAVGRSGGSQNKKSFAEIQREQQREQQHRHQQQLGQRDQEQEGGSGIRQQVGWQQGQREMQKQQPPRVDELGRLMRPSAPSSAVNPRSISSGSNPRGGGGGGGNRRTVNAATTNIRASLPIEQGVIHTLLDKFGFIKCADRDRELFFHYSECRGLHSDELQPGDEVEFRVGRAEERGGGGGRRGGSQAGADGEEKLSAFEVKRLPKGTIYWEKEDEPVGKRRRGVVDRIAREEQPRRGDRGREGGSSGGMGLAAVEGLIRLIDIDCGEKENICGKEGKEKEEGDGDEGKMKVEVHYTPSDCKALSLKKAQPVRGSGLLERKDLVEFTLFTERRTKKKYARNITLVRSERERQRLEHEAKLLDDATLERGEVISSKGEYGFLRSANRLEEVYYHISHVLSSSEEDADDNGTGRDNRIASLKEGQDVEFYVVNEAGGVGGGSGRKGTKGVSARKIKLLPRGSVKFERTIASGVAGVVIDCPVGNVVDPFGKRGGAGGSGGSPNNVAEVGRIRLEDPIIDDEDGDDLVTHVTLHPELYPGGMFAISRTGSEVGTFIRPGDVLLFDVVKKVMDGTCHAVPTKFARRSLPQAENGGGGGNTVPVVADDGVDNVVDSSIAAVKPSVRLIEPSLCGRAEGVVRAVHDNYGFISLAERGSGNTVVDAYFPMFEFFPSEIQMDLARNNNLNVDLGDADIQNKGGRIHVEVGMEVAFDLSLQTLTNIVGGGSSRGSGGRYGNSRGAVQERESLRARRIQILPRGTVKEKIPISVGLQATVSKEDQKQPFVGSLELKEPVKFDALSARHPLVARLLDDISQGKYGIEEGVKFHDVLSDKDAQVVISMVNLRSDLEWSYVDGPENNDGDDSRSKSSGKLCIMKKKLTDGGEGLEASSVPVKPPPSAAAFEASAHSSEGINGVTDEKGDGIHERNDGGLDGDGVSMEVATSTITEKHEANNKKRSKKAKVARQLRFDRSSFSDISVAPLRVGDIVTCDVYQSRRSGALVVENILVIERKERPAAAVMSDGDEDGKENNHASKQRKGLSGFVTEVVVNRQFGFITAVDEQGARTGDHVFFHFKEVKLPWGADGTADAAQDRGSGRGKKTPGKGDVAVIRKGDEVKFDAGPGKNGKLTATNISIMSRGTLKIPTRAADKSVSSCTGYVLMEPSHTSLANTPSHIVLQGGSTSAAGSSGGSRWDNVRDDRSATANSKASGLSSTKEEGVILLLSDPLHLFSPKLKVDSAAGEDATAASEDKAGTDNSLADSSDTGFNTEKDVVKEEAKHAQPVKVGMHLRYKLGSVNIERGSSGPKRGDLVSFGKTKGAKLVKDIRIERAAAAVGMRGILVDIDRDNNTATFISSEKNGDDDAGKKYEIKLTEVVSCDKSLLKEREQVDGILHEGKIFGVCRTKDIFLASSINRSSSGSSGGLKERPRLNLTVKKELQGMGGKIMAQSQMAKGPDGTNGFAVGWTKRRSLHATVAIEATATEKVDSPPSTSLSAAASEFVPHQLFSHFPIDPHNFASMESG